MGVSFQVAHHLPWSCGTAPKSNDLMEAAPQSFISMATNIFCACLAKS